MVPIRILTVLALAMGVGCSSPAPSPAPSPADVPSPAPVAPAAPAAPARPPEAWGGAPSAAAVITAEGAPQLAAPTSVRTPQSGDAATRCARLSGLLLEDVERMLGFLGATEAQTRFTVDQLRPSYGSEFTDKCATATPEILTCVETADNAFTGLARCRLNQGRPFAERVSLHPADPYVPWNIAEREVRDATAAAALRAGLIGSWDLAGRETWVFTAEGDATHTVVLESGEHLVNAYRFTPTSGTRFFNTMKDGSNGGEPVGFDSAVVAGDTLYRRPGPGGSAQPIAESGPTLATGGGNWLIQDIRATPRCTGFNLVGQPAQSASCGWEGEGDARRLRITAAFGHDINTGEPVPEVTVRFREMSGQIVPAEDATSFLRRAGPSGTSPKP
jgi:hypothetical protein